ncbi:MAG: extracellular solute-binding protein [bacterium]|nr:extracellular solute-binding protein [bacterium]
MRKAILIISIILIATNTLWAAPKLIIVSPHWEGIRKEFTRTYQQWYMKNYGGNVEIEWLDQGGGADVLRYIKSEFSKKPDGIGIDLFFGGGLEPYLELAKSNLLYSYRVSDKQLKNIPSSYYGIPLYDKQYRWYGVALSGFGILENSVVTKKLGLPAVKTWADLTHPRLRGWVGSADPRHSGSVHMMYEIILQAYGWERGWENITLLGANVKSFPKTASVTPEDVKLGEVAYGLAIDVYAWSKINEVGKDKMRFIFPQGVTVINPDCIAILKGAPNLTEAKSFLEFTLTSEAQKLLMLPKGTPEGPKEFTLTRMSVIPRLYEELNSRSIIPFNPFRSHGGMKYNFEIGSARYMILNDLIGAMIIDTHSELIQAWNKIIARGLNPMEKHQLGRPPISEEEALQLAQTKWNDQAFRNQKIAEWIRFAQQKYTSLIKTNKN